METRGSQNESPEAVNIFADFTNDKKLSEDVNKIEEKKKKTPLYYIWITTNILKSLNIVFFLWIVTFYAYYYAQKSDNIDLSLLDPVCSLFIGNVSSLDNGCTWVTSLLNKIENQTETLKKTQYSKISSVIWDVYATENFIYSKEISFLIDKSKTRVKPLEVLKEFDRLKNEFEPYEKSKIICSDLVFSVGNNLKVTCEAYSSDWDSKIVGFSWDKSRESVQGTSISVANSFLNYIQENSQVFTLLNRQKVFSTFPINENGPYTKKTVFYIELGYNSDNL
jgi:hypothetical protein